MRSDGRPHLLPDTLFGLDDVQARNAKKAKKEAIDKATKEANGEPEEDLGLALKQTAEPLYVSSGEWQGCAERVNRKASGKATAAAAASEAKKKVSTKNMKPKKGTPPPPPAPPAPPPSSDPANIAGDPGVPKLTKAEWRQVQAIKMLDRWQGQPNMVSYKIVPPTEIDKHYFWIYWDTPAGRQGKDQCGWSVADLNKELQDGALVFRKANSSQWVSRF